MSELKTGSALPVRMCSHQFVNFINREKPPPCEILYHCKCGESWGCPVCGWGAGAYPCSCMREHMTASEERK